MAYHQNYETYRCRLFEGIAEGVWDKIIRSHRLGLNANELGITSDILVDIIEHNENAYRNFRVYVKNGWRENDYGSDMDVFVEIRKGQYHWYALQAKLLKNNNRYTTFRDTNDGIMQWDKLHHLEALTGCKAYYLLYNGKADFNHDAADKCNNPFTQEQFGCSLVEINKINELATIVDQRGRHVNPTFEDIHPEHAQPWRVLTCCRHGLYSSTLYSMSDVKGSTKEYTEIDGRNTYFDIFDQPNFFSAEENPIINYSRQVNWKPDIKIVINNTSSIWKYDQSN